MTFCNDHKTLIFKFLFFFVAFIREVVGSNPVETNNKNKIVSHFPFYRLKQGGKIMGRRGLQFFGTFIFLITNTYKIILWGNPNIHQLKTEIFFLKDSRTNNLRFERKYRMQFFFLNIWTTNEFEKNLHFLHTHLRKYLVRIF